MIISNHDQQWTEKYSRENVKKRDFGNGHFIDLKHIGAGAKWRGLDPVSRFTHFISNQ